MFDLGGVLIDWNPRHLYRKIFATDDEVEAFLDEVGLMSWNDRLDQGLPFAEGVAEWSAAFPGRADHIAAFHERWVETIAGPVDGTAAVLDELRVRGVPIYALSNWSTETFGLVRHEYPFLEWFDGILLSAEVGVTKPDRRIFDELCARYGLDPARTLFVDDNPPNVDGARAAGLQAVLFKSATTLRDDLCRLGVLGTD